VLVAVATLSLPCTAADVDMSESALRVALPAATPGHVVGRARGAAIANPVKVTVYHSHPVRVCAQSDSCVFVTARPTHPHHCLLQHNHACTHPVRSPYEHAIVRAPAHSLDAKFPTLQSPHSHAIHCWLASQLLPKHSLQSAVQSRRAAHTRAHCSCHHNSHAIHLPTCAVLIPTPHLTFFPRAFC
jgi:hypothetical protein